MPGLLGGIEAALRRIGTVRQQPDASDAAPLKQASRRVYRVLLVLPAFSCKRRAPSNRPRKLEILVAERDGQDAFFAKPETVQSNFLQHRHRSSGGSPGPLPGLGGGFDQRTRGDVVHGWFEHWGFDGTATTDAAQRYLDASWPLLAEQQGLAEATAALGTSALAIPGARALLCERDSRLDFETGIVASLDGDLLVGRADLIIHHPDGWVSVVDVKGSWGEAGAGDGPLRASGSREERPFGRAALRRACERA